jgi:hypothetical protein
MTQASDDPATGPGTTSDPNQSNRHVRHDRQGKRVPDDPPGPPQRNDDPATGPGTTDDPNQSTNAD